MSRFEVYLSKNDLEHIANGHDIKIKIDGKRFLTTNEIILKPALMNDVMAPILNYKNKIINTEQQDIVNSFIRRCKMIPKFRGLSIDENSKGEWQYGHLIEDRGRAFIINEVVEANEQYITIGSWCPVNIESVGRFTGMFDEKLREIYEKDVLGTKDGLLNGIVEYREDLGMFVNSLIRYNNFERLCNVASSREIIGNIYENPELLEVE